MNVRRLVNWAVIGLVLLVGCAAPPGDEVAIAPPGAIETATAAPATLVVATAIPPTLTAIIYPLVADEPLTHFVQTYVPHALSPDRDRAALGYGYGSTLVDG